MSSSEYPWLAGADGVGALADDGMRCNVFVLAAYPLLLLLVVLSALVKYMWIPLTGYCTLIFVLSCCCRGLARPGGLPGPGAGAEVAAIAAVREGSDGGGLGSSAVAAMPAFTYGAEAGGKDGGGGGGEARCAVCLEAVRSGETVRRLPACAHLFHVECIDMWLGSHATCPVCRRRVDPWLDGKKVPETCALPVSLPLPPV